MGCKMDVLMKHDTGVNWPLWLQLTLLFIILGLFTSRNGTAQTEPASFERDVQPVLKKYCFRCHGPDTQEGNVRLDVLDPDLVKGIDTERWHQALNIINLGEMPPDGEPQIDETKLEQLTGWLQSELTKAIEARQNSHRSIIRRLTSDAYSNTLQQLLEIDVDYGNVLPDDGKSKSGFSNNASVLQATQLHLEYFEKIARAAVDQAIFTEKPKTMRYRIRIADSIGQNISKEKSAGRFGGYVSQPIDPIHLHAEVLNQMGNPVEINVSAKSGLYANVLHNLGIGMRGSHKHRYQVSEMGILLDSAVPHQEVAPGSWHCPSPNLKMLIRRDFPDKGNFVFRVTAAHVPGRVTPVPQSYPADKALTTITPTGIHTLDNTLIKRAEQAATLQNTVIQNGFLVLTEPENPELTGIASFSIQTPEDHLYQMEVVHTVVAENQNTELSVEFSEPLLTLRHPLQTASPKDPVTRNVTPLGIIPLSAGTHPCTIKWKGSAKIEKLLLVPLAKNHPVLKSHIQSVTRAKVLREEQQNESRKPTLQVALGNRTDDGVDSQTFDSIKKMSSPVYDGDVYEFYGRLENLPVPQVDLGEQTTLSNILVLAVWNGDFVKDQDDPGSRILINQVEFEAPYFPEWPPRSHSKIFFDSPNQTNREVYTREIITRFMEEAFRQPAPPETVDLYYQFWLNIRNDFPQYEQGIKEVLVAVLCSPKFLYLAEATSEGKSDIQKDLELASRLSYFLWNHPPDERLYTLAKQGSLRGHLSSEVKRLIADPRSWHFVRSFCDQWLKVYRHHEMQVDVTEHPSFTRFVKNDLAEETYHFTRHVMQNNMSIFTLIDSDFVMINQNLAEFYGIPGVQGTDFQVTPVSPEMKRGGLMTQGSFLSGHSDGNQGHPIKRAVWLMERILGETPPPPPPNVPDLDPKDPVNQQLSIAQQLAIHRDSVSCRNCHKKLDPYGLVFEEYNGAGLLNPPTTPAQDTKVTLPTGVIVNGVAEMKDYIVQSKGREFRTSLVKHLLTYALGRDMSFADEKDIKSIVETLSAKGDRFQTLVETLVTSPLFLR